MYTMEVFQPIVLLVGVMATVRAGLPHAPPLLPPLGPPVPPPPPRPPVSMNNDYGYRYSVNDQNGNEHSHQQQRVGNAVTGQYKVLLPDGRLQTVTYIADEKGYRAKVEYTPARPGEATSAGVVQPFPAGSSAYPSYPSYTSLSGSRASSASTGRDEDLIMIQPTDKQKAFINNARTAYKTGPNVDTITGSFSSPRRQPSP